MKPIPQFDLPACREVFNLAGECAIDGERVIRERLETMRRQEEARKIVQKCQKTFEQCPGFIGGDAPEGRSATGRVVVEPRQATEARQYLKRRFVVNENLTISVDGGLCFEIALRGPRKKYQRRQQPFEKLEQFEFNL